jgi:hypothetical protein
MSKYDDEIQRLRTALREIAFHAHASRDLKSAAFKALVLEDIERRACAALREPELEIVKKRT